jgi:hypothetical protein
MVMSDYRDSIHGRIDPEQSGQLPDGTWVQPISVIMTDHHPFQARGRCWLPPSVCTLTPDQARELAASLLALADQAERIGARP